MSNYRLITPPSTEPLTLAEVKDHVFVPQSETAYDTYLTTLITVSREYVEGQIWRPLITQTWALNFDFNEVNNLVKLINKSPLIAVTGVTYFDSSNTQQTLLASKYDVDVYSNPARFQIKEVPTCYDKFNTLSVQFTCGYGNAASVPKRIKQAMLLIIGHLFENRQDVITGTQVQYIKDNSERLLEPYRNNFIFENQS
jgi:uncharacterized phiE125 gp8 family phage protein